MAKKPRESRVGDAAALGFILCGKCGLPFTAKGLGAHAPLVPWNQSRAAREVTERQTKAEVNAGSPRRQAHPSFDNNTLEKIDPEGKTPRRVFSPLSLRLAEKGA